MNGLMQDISRVSRVFSKFGNFLSVASGGTYCMYSRDVLGKGTMRLHADAGVEGILFFSHGYGLGSSVTASVLLHHGSGMRRDVPHTGALKKGIPCS